MFIEKPNKKDNYGEMLTHTNVSVDSITGCVFYTQFLVSGSFTFSFYSTHSDHSCSAFLRAYTDHSLYPLTLPFLHGEKRDPWVRSINSPVPITLSTHIQKAKDGERLACKILHHLSQVYLSDFIPHHFLNAPFGPGHWPLTISKMCHSLSDLWESCPYCSFA